MIMCLLALAGRVAPGAGLLIRVMLLEGKSTTASFAWHNMFGSMVQSEWFGLVWTTLEGPFEMHVFLVYAHL